MMCSAEHQVWDTQASCKVGGVLSSMILDERASGQCVRAAFRAGVDDM